MSRLSNVVCFVGVLSFFALLAGPAAAGDDTDDLKRKTPSGQYIDPASFFRFHGYVSLSYTEAGKDLGPAPDGTPHILVSGPGPSARTGENEGGFRNDSALFVGGEPFEGVGSVIEIHFVGDGPAHVGVSEMAKQEHRQRQAHQSPELNANSLTEH